MSVNYESDIAKFAPQTNKMNMRNKILLLTILIIGICQSVMAANENVLIERWKKYIETTSMDEARSFIDPIDFSSIYNFVKPGSNIVKEMSAVSQEIYGNSGRIFFKIYGFKIWMAFKKINNNWVMTMDENELLEVLTSSWIKTKIKNVTYVSSSPLTEETLKEAEKFALENERLSKEFGIDLDNFKYYYALVGDEAENIVSEFEKGAGKARYRAIKAVETVNHVHELVHIYAFEFGSGNTFIDEGIATALGNGNMIKKSITAQNVLEMIKNDGFEKYLDPPVFVEANMKRKDVYALAQLTMIYWKEKFGMEQIKQLLKVQKNTQINLVEYIEENFEKCEHTNLALRKILNERIESQMKN